MDRCVDKTALVTGAGRGIGQGIAEALAREGAFVYVSDLNESSADAVAKSIQNMGGQATPLALDVTSSQHWNGVAEFIAAQHGALDILVNNAGIEMIASISDLGFAQWKKTQSINVDGVFLGVKTLLDLLKIGGLRNDGGASIINISSIAGIVGVADQVAYNTSKGAVRAMSKAMAIEFAQKDFNIRVNSIHPGCIHTAMLDDLFVSWQKNKTVGTDDLGEIQAVVANLHPLKRIGKVSDVAMAAVYIGSEEAAFMTGSELVIDGGWIAQ